MSDDDIERLIYHLTSFEKVNKTTVLLPMLDLNDFRPQAAYLVGVSDPNSSAGQKGLVDPAQFARANQSIQMACQNLVDPACTQSQVHWDSFHFLFFTWFFLLLHSSYMIPRVGSVTQHAWRHLSMLPLCLGAIRRHHCGQTHICVVQRLPTGLLQDSQPRGQEAVCPVSQRSGQHHRQPG